MEYHGSSGDDDLDQTRLALPAGVVLYGEAGNDRLTLSNGLGVGGAGDDTITRSGPWGGVAYWNSPAGVRVDLAAGRADDGFGGHDTLVNLLEVQGSPFDDVLRGSSTDEFFAAFGGNNVVDGGGGFDTYTYFSQRSDQAQVSYDAATDTFTIVKQFSNGDHGVDRLSGIERIQFVGDGADGKVILRSAVAGDFRSPGPVLRVPVPEGADVSQFKIADVNGDGHADFLYVTQAGSGTALAPTYGYVGDGKGGFANATAALFGTPPQMVVGGGRSIVADFNGDGRDDLFQLDFGNDAPPFAGGMNHLFLSGPDGLRDASASLPRRNDLNHGGSVGDVNGDGAPDVLVNTLDEGNILLINDGHGQFTERPDLLPRVTVDLGWGVLPETSTFSGIVDVNGDGAADLILGTWDGSPVAGGSKVLLNDGHGNFTHGAPILLPDSGIARQIVLEVEPIDLNGDRFPDLMLSITNGGAQDVFYHADYIQLLVNDGTGHFRDETDARLPQSRDSSEPGWLLSLAAVDFNNDGLPDILAESAGAPVTSKVYLNTGDGHFRLDWESPPGLRAGVADVNEDGLRDIVTAIGPGDVSVWVNHLNNGHVYQANFGGDQLRGSALDDVFYARAGDDRFDGAGGLDTAVLAGARTAYRVSASGDGFTLTAPGSTVRLSQVERVLFDDGALAFDLAGAGGQAYRLYQAAFARTPDPAGLGYWIGALDHGAALTDVAAQFAGSAEFAARYGALDDAAFLATIYQNVLHRAPDAGGMAFWGDYLGHGGARATLLAAFSESIENQAQVIGAIAGGIAFLPFH